MALALEGRLSSLQDGYQAHEEGRSSSVSALLERINSANKELESEQEKESKAPTSSGPATIRLLQQAISSNQETSDVIFPWLQSFQTVCQKAVGTRSLRILENLMSEFIKLITPEYKNCQSKPVRAAKVKKCLHEAIVYFHFSYQDIKESLEHSTYLDRMVTIISMYTDMEIKSSIRGKETTKKITSRVTSLLHIALDYSQEHILDSVLQCSSFTKSNKEICSSILSKLLSEQPPEPRHDMLYVRLLLAFKLWKGLLKEGEEKKKLNKLASECLPSNASILDRPKNLTDVLPRIPKKKKNVTHFLMVSKFNVKEACQAFLKSTRATQPEFPTEMPAILAELDKSLFFNASPKAGTSETLDKEEGDTSSSLLNDIWSSLSIEALGERSVVKDTPVSTVPPVVVPSIIEPTPSVIAELVTPTIPVNITPVATISPGTASLLAKLKGETATPIVESPKKKRKCSSPGDGDLPKKKKKKKKDVAADKTEPKKKGQKKKSANKQGETTNNVSKKKKKKSSLVKAEKADSCNSVEEKVQAQGPAKVPEVVAPVAEKTVVTTADEITPTVHTKPMLSVAPLTNLTKQSVSVPTAIKPSVLLAPPPMIPSMLPTVPPSMNSVPKASVAPVTEASMSPSNVSRPPLLAMIPTQISNNLAPPPLTNLTVPPPTLTGPHLPSLMAAPIGPPISATMPTLTGAPIVANLSVPPPLSRFNVPPPTLLPSPPAECNSDPDDIQKRVLQIKQEKIDNPTIGCTDYSKPIPTSLLLLPPPPPPDDPRPPTPPLPPLPQTQPQPPPPPPPDEEEEEERFTLRSTPLAKLLPPKQDRKPHQVASTPKLRLCTDSLIPHENPLDANSKVMEVHATLISTETPVVNAKQPVPILKTSKSRHTSLVDTVLTAPENIPVDKSAECISPKQTSSTRHSSLRHNSSLSPHHSSMATCHASSASPPSSASPSSSGSACQSVASPKYNSSSLSQASATPITSPRYSSSPHPSASPSYTCSTSPHSYASPRHNTRSTTSSRHSSSSPHSTASPRHVSSSDYSSRRRASTEMKSPVDSVSSSPVYTSLKSPTYSPMMSPSNTIKSPSYHSASSQMKSPSAHRSSSSPSPVRTSPRSSSSPHRTSSHSPRRSSPSPTNSSKPATSQPLAQLHILQQLHPVHTKDQMKSDAKDISNYDKQMTKSGDLKQNEAQSVISNMLSQKEALAKQEEKARIKQEHAAQQRKLQQQQNEERLKREEEVKQQLKIKEEIERKERMRQQKLLEDQRRKEELRRREEARREKEEKEKQRQLLEEERIRKIQEAEMDRRRQEKERELRELRLEEERRLKEEERIRKFQEEERDRRNKEEREKQLRLLEERKRLEEKERNRKLQEAEQERRIKAEKEKQRKIEEEREKQRRMQEEKDRQRKIQEENERLRKIQEEKERQRRIQEEKERRRILEEERLREQEKIRKQLEAEEKERKRREEERRQEELRLQEEARLKKLEEERQRKKLEDEARRQRQLQEEALRKQREEEEARKQKQEELRRKQLEEENRRKKQLEEELRRQKQQEELRKQKEQEEELRKQKQIEEESRKRKQIEEELRRQKQIEEEARRQKQIEEEIKRQKQMEELKAVVARKQEELRLKDEQRAQDEARHKKMVEELRAQEQAQKEQIRLKEEELHRKEEELKRQEALRKKEEELRRQEEVRQRELERQLKIAEDLKRQEEAKRKKALAEEEILRKHLQEQAKQAKMLEEQKHQIEQQRQTILQHEQQLVHQRQHVSALSIHHHSNSVLMNYSPTEESRSRSRDPVVTNIVADPLSIPAVSPLTVQPPRAHLQCSSPTRQEPSFYSNNPFGCTNLHQDMNISSFPDDVLIGDGRESIFNSSNDNLMCGLFMAPLAHVPLLRPAVQDSQSEDNDIDSPLHERIDPQEYQDFQDFSSRLYNNEFELTDPSDPMWKVPGPLWNHTMTSQIELGEDFAMDIFPEEAGSSSTEEETSGGAVSSNNTSNVCSTSSSEANFNVSGNSSVLVESAVSSRIQDEVVVQSDNIKTNVRPPAGKGLRNHSSINKEQNDPTKDNNIAPSVNPVVSIPPRDSLADSIDSVAKGCGSTSVDVSRPASRGMLDHNRRLAKFRQYREALFKYAVANNMFFPVNHPRAHENKIIFHRLLVHQVNKNAAFHNARRAMRATHPLPPTSVISCTPASDANPVITPEMNTTIALTRPDPPATPFRMPPPPPEPPLVDKNAEQNPKTSYHANAETSQSLYKLVGTGTVGNVDDDIRKKVEEAIKTLEDEPGFQLAVERHNDHFLPLKKRKQAITVIEPPKTDENSNNTNNINSPTSTQAATPLPPPSEPPTQQECYPPTLMISIAELEATVKQQIPSNSDYQLSQLDTRPMYQPLAPKTNQTINCVPNVAPPAPLKVPMVPSVARETTSRYSKSILPQYPNNAAYSQLTFERQRSPDSQIQVALQYKKPEPTRRDLYNSGSSVVDSRPLAYGYNLYQPVSEPSAQNSQSSKQAGKTDRNSRKRSSKTEEEDGKKKQRGRKK